MPNVTLPDGTVKSYNQSLTVADLELPDGINVSLPSDSLLVQCVEPTAELEPEEEGDLEAAEDTGGAGEPEIIGRKEEGEDEEEATDS